MLFDPTKLPEREWLKLSEVVNFLALGEALHATDQVPADRTHLAEIGAALERCRSQARAGTRSAERSDFLEMFGSNDSYAPFPPTSAQLERFKTAWPPYSQRLYDLVVEWESAHEQENKRRGEAEQEVLQWLLSGEVQFDGTIVEDDRRGCRERIDANLIFNPEIFWAHDRIAAHPRDGHSRRPGEPHPMLVWDEVQIKRSSLVRWLRPPPPDPTRFDPMQEPYWTLPMAVAWIRSMSADAVREQWNRWLKHCRVRRLRDDGKYYLEVERKASFGEMIAASQENCNAWNVLRQAALAAVRIDPQTRAHLPVDLQEWAASENRAASNATDAPELHTSHSAYDEVRLRSADVLRLWPAALSAAGEESTTSSQPLRGRGPPVQYVTDDSIVDRILKVLEREPDRRVAPLILSTADALGCSPRTERELVRLVDRVTRKVRRQRRRVAKQRPG